MDIVYHVYVCDIDKPWAIHRLASVTDQVVSLEWHSSGLQLFVATYLGVVYVFSMKDFLLNLWHEKPSIVNAVGEEIIAVSWLHPGGMKTYCADKKDVAMYSEKVVNMKFLPSLSQYGGKPVDGLIVITATETAVVAIPKLDAVESGGLSSEMSVQMGSLCGIRSSSRARVADIGFDANGGILVVTSDGSIASPIKCHRLELCHNLHRSNSSVCTVKSAPVASFFAHCYTTALMREAPTAKVTHVRYVERNSDGQMLLVGAGDDNGSHVELWQLTNRQVNIHKFFHSPDTVIPPSVKVQRWVHQSTISHASMPTSVAVPRFPVSYGSAGGHSSSMGSSVLSPSHNDTMLTSSSVLFQYIAIAYRDGSVKLVDKSTFQPMTTTNLDTGITDFECSKRRRSIAYMTCMQQTLPGCVLVGIDQYSCLYVMKTMNTRDPVTQVPPPYLVGMFEYLMISGIDWWDVLTAVKPGMVETIQQRLLDDINKQHRQLQELNFSRLMAIRASLARCTSNGQARAAECHCQLMLHSVYNHFRSVLRPKLLAANEPSPADRLAVSCTRCQDTEIDNVICAIGTEKKFVVDTATQQSMQPLIQWVADLALYLVTALPMLHHSAMPYIGASLLRNSRVLATIREILVVVRMWGLVNVSCLPTFTTTVAGVDMLDVLFRLITRIWIAAVESAGRDFDDSLVDECCTVAGQVIQNPVDDGLFGNIENAASTFTPAQSYPVKYVFGEPPATSSRRTSSLFPPGIYLSAHRRDVVRQTILGNQSPDLVRVCLRCCCASFVTSQHRTIAKAPAARVWELRFERSCICGGQWMLESGLKS